MSKKTEKYFNFPIVLLNGFLRNDREALSNIFDFAIYENSLNYDCGELESIRKACKYFGVKAGNIESTFENGKLLFESIPQNTPKAGLKLELFFEYYKTEKTEFEKICLLGFLAIKSILQKQPYTKITNKYFLSRMDGKTKSVKDYSELSAEILKYANEYQIKKIKYELIFNWGLEHYSRYTRGFYVSFSLDLETLIYHAEKRRLTTHKKQRIEQEKLALKKAKNLLK